MKNNPVTIITLGRYKTSPSLYNTEDFTAVYQFSFLQSIKYHSPEDRYKLAMASRKERKGQGEGAGRGRERYTPGAIHRAFLASFLALSPSLNSRKKSSALIHRFFHVAHLHGHGQGLEMSKAHSQQAELKMNIFALKFTYIK